MSEAANAHAGQGPVLLDIGGDVGALVVTARPAMVGREIEIRPVDRPAPDHLAHVAVVARPTPHGLRHTAVFAELDEGDYELYDRADGALAVRVTVRGGHVCQAQWPA
ncbi:MAG: hypothetical protein JWO57_4472 [Pseudonocardiales bacterium]|jgi:hypothetical protein|nr:hypothetical protein [Pseudonocardiales bacterium]